MWSSVGSAGTVDPTDGGKVLFDGAIAQLGIGVIVVSTSVRAEAATSARADAAARPRSLAAFIPKISATIRYAVTVPDGIDGLDAFNISLQLRYRSGDGQVLATLFEVPIPSPPDPGVVYETPLNQFDSEIQGSVSDLFQNGDVGGSPENAGHKIDFSNNVYYVAVTLIGPNRPFVNVPPAVAAVRIFSWS